MKIISKKKEVKIAKLLAACTFILERSNPTGDDIESNSKLVENLANISAEIGLSNLYLTMIFLDELRKKFPLEEKDAVDG